MLDKIYRFDTDTICANFGTSLRMLAEYASLGVISPPQIPEQSCTFDSAKDAQTFHDILKFQDYVGGT